MASSSSSDEEHLDKLREATDLQFINDGMFNKTKLQNHKDANTETSQPQLPSLRPTKDDAEQFNLLHVTPEFQSYVARQLSDLLEKQLQQKLADIEYKPAVKCKKTGVKLFSDSTKYISLKEENIRVLKRSDIKKRTVEKDECVDENVKVTLCAVDPEHVLSRKETTFWTERCRGEVFNYKRVNDGELVYVEKKFK